MRDGRWCPRKLSNPVQDSRSQAQTLRGGDASRGLPDFLGGQAPAFVKPPPPKAVCGDCPLTAETPWVSDYVEQASPSVLS